MSSGFWHVRGVDLPQGILISLVHQAKTAFGNVFGQQDGRSAIVEHRFELSIYNPQVGSSLPMYYAFYYQPLFRSFHSQRLVSEVFSSTKMNSWIHRMRLASSDLHKSSPEIHAFFDLAANGNELV